jgi:hypothetical protein
MEMEGQCRKNARTMKKVAGRRRGGNEGKNTAVFRRRPTEKPFNEVAGLQVVGVGWGGRGKKTGRVNKEQKKRGGKERQTALEGGGG